jgi:hypothetical protein
MPRAWSFVEVGIVIGMKVPFFHRKLWLVPPSQDPPTMWPCTLILEAEVHVEPGISSVRNVYEPWAAADTTHTSILNTIPIRRVVIGLPPHELS